MLHVKPQNFSICIVGWYFYNSCLDQLINDERAFLVAHRDHPILKQMPSILIENIGLEYHCYSWYLDNKWNGKDSVLFTHDDCSYEKETINAIAIKATEYDISSFGRLGGGRCFVMSPRALEFWLDRGGIYYDETNTGQVHGKTPKGRAYSRGASRMQKMWEEMVKEGLILRTGLHIPGYITAKRGKLLS